MAEEGKNDINEADIEALNKDIEDAKSKLVSKETEEKLSAAKEEAKKEAAKEFEVNQRIKELEAQNEVYKKQMEDKEKEAAEKITILSDKVNSYIESKAVVSNNNPFDNKTNNSNEQVSDEDIENIEKQSYAAFVDERVRQP